MDKRIDKYIDSFPQDVKKRLTSIRKLIHELVPDMQETISYGMPAFKKDKVLIYFSGYKKHIGIYPFPTGVEYFQKLSTQYKTSKGAIQFSNDKDIPVQLLKEIILFRVKESTK